MNFNPRIAVGALSLSAAALVAVANFEEFRGEAYVPVPGDVPTIGFGSTEGVQIGDKISVPQALERLRRDVGKAESAIGKCVTVPLSQGEFDAFASFAFNVGGAAFCGSTLVKKLNSGDYDGACAELKRWTCGPDPTGKYAAQSPGHKCGAGKAPLPGLVARRSEEFRMCMEGKQ